MGLLQKCQRAGTPAAKREEQIVDLQLIICYIGLATSLLSFSAEALYSQISRDHISAAHGGLAAFCSGQGR